jgi:hypothetical protein
MKSAGLTDPIEMIIVDAIFYGTLGHQLCSI